jgi:branched-chain amino acid transport system permease protein
MAEGIQPQPTSESWLVRVYNERRESWNIFFGLIAVILIFAFLVAARGNVGTFISIVFSGLRLASFLFLVAAGLSLIFGLMDILNFAHGQFFMIGAYLTFDITHWNESAINRFFTDTLGLNIDLMTAIPDPNLRFLFAIILSTLLGGGLGMILERVMLRPLYSRPLFQLVLTFGVSVLMLEAIRAIYSETPRTWRLEDPDIFLRDVSFNLAGTQYDLYRLFIIITGLALVIIIALILNRTRIGIIIRAGVENPEMVRALGINVRSVFTLVFALGCAVASFGGAIAMPSIGATTGMGAAYLVAAIAVIVIGGLGSYEGTAYGALIVGLAWATMNQYSVRPEVASVWGSITPMLVLGGVLILRPRGLFGEER